MESIRAHNRELQARWRADPTRDTLWKRVTKHDRYSWWTRKWFLYLWVLFLLILGIAFGVVGSIANESVRSRTDLTEAEKEQRLAGWTFSAAIGCVGAAAVLFLVARAYRADDSILWQWTPRRAP